MKNTKISFILVLVMPLFLLSACKSGDNKVDVSTPFDEEAITKKIRENYSAGEFYKGSDPELYYKDWYKDVIDHALFGNYINAKNYIIKTIRDISRTSSGLIDYGRCDGGLLDPVDPDFNEDLKHTLQINQCVMDNIVKVFKNEIPEFKKSFNNRESRFDFHFYMSSVYSTHPSDLINNKQKY